MDRFVDRCDAGRQLAAKLANRCDFENAIVFGLPRGGPSEVTTHFVRPSKTLATRSWRRSSLGGMGTVNRPYSNWLGCPLPEAIKLRRLPLI
jgi:hypothetical protein